MMTRETPLALRPTVPSRMPNRPEKMPLITLSERLPTTVSPKIATKNISPGVFSRMAVTAPPKMPPV